MPVIVFAPRSTKPNPLWPLCRMTVRGSLYLNQTRASRQLSLTGKRVNRYLQRFHPWSRPVILCSHFSTTGSSGFHGLSQLQNGNWHRQGHAHIWHTSSFGDDSRAGMMSSRRDSGRVAQPDFLHATGREIATVSP